MSQKLKKENLKSEVERKRRLKEGFDFRSSVYQHAPWLYKKWLLEKPLDLLQLKKDETVLEIGVGTGIVSSHLVKYDIRKIVGIDLSEKMLEKAATTISRPSLLRYDVEKIAELFLPAAFDVVMSRNLLTHVQIPDVLQGVHQVLRPDGKLLLIEACTLHPEDSSFFLQFAEFLHPGHISYPAHSDLQRLVQQAGFSIKFEKLVRYKVNLLGYLSSSKNVKKRSKIFRHFHDAPEIIKERYQFLESDHDILFQGYWKVLIGQKS